jgi:chromosomal replication initiation ATPase DnaA
MQRYTKDEFITAAGLAGEEWAKKVCKFLPLVSSESPSMNLEEILRIVCDEYGIPVISAKSKSKVRINTDARHVFCALAKTVFPSKTLGLVAEVINADHSTVLYGIKETWRVREKEQVYNKLKSKITNNEA